jgi:hypothetical protein
MELLGVEEGPIVGEAMAHLEDLRMLHGPLDDVAARRSLTEWWQSRSG